MKHLKTTITSLFLFSSFVVWASGPASPTTILHEDSVFSTWEHSGVSPLELSQYGINTVWYKRIEYGLKTGFNFTPNGSNPSLFINPEFGPVFGGTAMLPFTNWFDVRLEILYSQYSFSGHTATSQYGPIADINKLNCIDVPLMLRINPIKSFDLSLLAGGDFQYIISTSYKYAEGSTNQPPAGPKPASSTVFGYVFGIEYTIYEITAGFRFTGGVPDNNNLSTPKTLVGQFTVAYTFIND